jgi:hypothetical protein
MNEKRGILDLGPVTLWILCTGFVLAVLVGLFV